MFVDTVILSIKDRDHTGILLTYDNYKTDIVNVDVNFSFLNMDTFN